MISKKYLILISSSVVVNESGHFFHVYIDNSGISSLVNHCYILFACCSIKLFVFFLVSCRSSLTILDTSPPSVIYMANIFQFVTCLLDWCMMHFLCF